MALEGRGYQGFCDKSIEAFVLKSVTMGGGGVKKYQKLRDVIYGRSLTYQWAWIRTIFNDENWIRHVLRRWT
jgi:hypothetical protein